LETAGNNAMAKIINGNDPGKKNQFYLLLNKVIDREK
jgi:hypothetical protein